jgi:hypothetical protein
MQTSNTENFNIWLFEPQVDSKIHTKRSRTSSGTYILILFAKTKPCHAERGQTVRKKEKKKKTYTFSPLLIGVKPSIKRARQQRHFPMTDLIMMEKHKRWELV